MAAVSSLGLTLSICGHNGFCVITLVLVDQFYWIFNTKIRGTEERLGLNLGIVAVSHGFQVIERQISYLLDIRVSSFPRQIMLQQRKQIST